MKKNYLLLLFALLLFAGKGMAQINPCNTVEATKHLYETNPDARRFMDEVAAGLKNFDFKNAHKTTDSATSDTFWYDIPIVVHIVHDYNYYYLDLAQGGYLGENISDDFIYNCVNDWNVVFAGANIDTATVIPCFKKWIGIPRIRLHLATIDPLGNPTKGITRHRSYLTYIGGDQSKLDDWPRASYVNIWSINMMSLSHANAAAYAYTPDGAGGAPFADGVISLAAYMKNYDFAYTPESVSKCINHELGHVFNLSHVFGNSNTAPNPDCGDDGVDDTPPTKGHGPSAGCALTSLSLYDTTCSINYFKIYPCVSCHGDSLVDYPDTNNSQNIMDYTYCSRMFTIGQCVRMRTALQNPLADRNNLWTQFNLLHTGALLPRPDLEPINEFSGVDYDSKNDSTTGLRYFTCPFITNSTKMNFNVESWRDTISLVHWQFGNGALVADTTTMGYFHWGKPCYVTNAFTQPGWLTFTMTATDTTGTTAGQAVRTPNSTTTTFASSVFITQPNATDPNGYYQEFDPGGDRNNWPTFNYYNNEFAWQIDEAHGFYDHYCLKYTGYDYRYNPFAGIYPSTGTPAGDFDDFFSIPFNLTNYTDSGVACNLNFYHAGASRSSNSLGVNDSLSIQYSTDSSNTWHHLYTVKKNELANNGSVYVPYFPIDQSEWLATSISIPMAIRQPYTLFRFRYFPSIGPDENSSGNNFFLDRINISSYLAEVSNVKAENGEIVIAPNPTVGNAYVIIKSDNATSAHVTVSDITGKVVYTTTQQISGTDTHIEIPQTAIAVKGIYLVQTIAGKNVNTQKLVVY